MKENKYDDSIFFEKYSKMPRSENGLKSAGEWISLKNLLPSFVGKRMLDLGCGFGWHCRYAAENGAEYVLGTDISEKMLEKARELTDTKLAVKIEYRRAAAEDLELKSNSFDIIISSLALHYIASFDEICLKVNEWLKSGGTFIFSAEHPVFTAKGEQDWHYGEGGVKLHWPVDGYFLEGKREAVFLGERVIKYHRTMTSYINGLLKNGFKINVFDEPQPSKRLIEEVPDMEEELRRPMMIIISAKKI